jgi:hypothetical protein
MVKTTRTIPDELVKRANEWLGEDGRTFFQRCLDDHGTISPVLTTADPIIAERTEDDNVIPIQPLRAIPHPVHFHEGMSVRNFMRKTGLCDGWDAHDYDDNWSTLIEKVLLCQPPEKKPS